MSNVLKDNAGIQPELKNIIIMDSIPALAQTTTSTYVQAEAQAVATKVDAIIAALKAKGLMLG